MKKDFILATVTIIVVLGLVGSLAFEKYDNAVNGRSRYIANHDHDFKKSACATLNSAWQQYIRDNIQQTKKTSSNPEDYNTACKILIEKGYINHKPPYDDILFIKGPMAEKCYFEVEEPTTQPH